MPDTAESLQREIDEALEELSRVATRLGAERDGNGGNGGGCFGCLFAPFGWLVKLLGGR